MEDTTHNIKVNWADILNGLGSYKFLKYFQQAEQNYEKTPDAFLKRFVELTKN
jgi:hypothetical protein